MQYSKITGADLSGPVPHDPYAEVQKLRAEQDEEQRLTGKFGKPLEMNITDGQGGAYSHVTGSFSFGDVPPPGDLTDDDEREEEEEEELRKQRVQQELDDKLEAADAEAKRQHKLKRKA